MTNLTIGLPSPEIKGVALPQSLPLDRILELAKQLISIPSVTGEEKQIMEFMQEELTKRGWNVERWPTSDPNRWNVFASAGTQIHA